VSTPPEMEIRVQGLRPEDVSVSDLAKLLTAAEEAILGAIEGQGDQAQVRVSLVRISRHSTGLHFATPTPRVVRPAFVQIAEAVRGSKILPLTSRSREGIRGLEDFSHRFGRVLEFRLPEEGKRTRPIATITPASTLFAYTADLIEGETSLYGKVERVGGSTPRVVLRVAEKVTVHCDVSEEVAKELGHRLYTWVGVGGRAKWSPYDHSIESFRVERVLPYVDTPITDAVTKLGALIGEYWTGVDALAWVATFRRGEDS
jgi:hypothetical protein